MKISYNWLKEYTDTGLSPERISELLTGCGLEVEGMEQFESVKGGLKGVVIGEVLTCVKHPNSDHLSLTTVRTGPGEPLKIVCGAANVAAGQRVPVATIGATLYFGEKEITIQRTKIRGEVSEGMICAEDELGLGNSHDGIMVLPADAEVGMAASEYFGITEDIVFSIGLTPNRVDAASHIGVARDLVAVVNNFGKSTGEEPGTFSLKKPDLSAFSIDNTNRKIHVAIDDPQACLRYSGITISGIQVGESPAWLRNRLLAVGLRPINNIVDITNYVLMETGQPLHAFDCDKISGDQVVIRKYPEGTSFVTLDGIERRLASSDLMISSRDEPMCIAGIFGGLHSGVNGETKNIFLESACFDPVHIRRSSKRHSLQTDASFRFERGSDVEITVEALKRAAILIRELAGGVISSEIADVYPNPQPKTEVTLNFRHLDRLVGKVLDRHIVHSILSDLGIGIMEPSPQGMEPTAHIPHPETTLLLQIPHYKVDVTREADVIEEILRIYGYNHIELNDELRSSLSYSPKPDPEQIQEKASEYLVSNGFYEMMNNSLTKSSYYVDNPDFNPSLGVSILNPISRDLDVMRQTLLFGALESAAYNINRKNQDLKFFEFGRVYNRSERKDDPLAGYHEETHLAMLLTGESANENWNQASRPTDLFDLKALLHTLFARIFPNPVKLVTEPYHSFSISDGLRYLAEGEQILTMGLVSPSLLKKFDLRQRICYAELNWDKVFELIKGKAILFEGLPKFPEVRRDLALVVDRQVTFEQIETIAFQAEKKLLLKVGLFDVYEGEKISAGKKSYALSFILQDREKTLTDKEIDNTMERLVKVFSDRLGAQLR